MHLSCSLDINTHIHNILGMLAYVFINFDLCITLKPETRQPLIQMQTAFDAYQAASAGNAEPAWEHPHPSLAYMGYSKLRTHTALRTYGRSMPGGIGPA